MKSDKYNQYFTAQFLMGPNSVRLLDELIEEYPLPSESDMCVLDLGCGNGITSMFLAKETGAKVYAADLWITEEANRERFAGWGMQEQLIPVHCDANELPFEKAMFNAVISIDAYHYFAGKEGFFSEKILPFIKRSGVALIAVPGIKNEYDGRSEELLAPWLGDEAYMFQSADFWKKIIGTHEEIAEVKTWEMNSFELSWKEWFNSNHKYAAGDQEYYESLIKPVTSFVGIMVRKK
ncbi:MAG: methyltransferase domain-containing protein [Ruminococcaceae bacterium]|nr:methyltransferase domain-containing protein [Oscillospiraceae bacterium]